MKISALISDVDGTLVTSTKTLTAASREAVADLQARGVRFAVVSARPPRGMQMLAEPLALQTPLAGFNGGAFTDRDLKVIEDHPLSPDAARRAHDLLSHRGVDVWVFSGLDWLLANLDNPHVATEIRAVHFQPTLVASFETALRSPYKVVGVSQDHALLAQVEREMQVALGGEASVARSQPYYLDITHPMANKGTAVARLAALMGVPLAEVAVIGDGHNDIGMFERAGLSIAMGNAAADVQSRARFVTASNDQDGFAEAVRRYILAP